MFLQYKDHEVINIKDLLLLDKDISHIGRDTCYKIVFRLTWDTWYWRFSNEEERDLVYNKILNHLEEVINLSL